jgi:hypothetical protein
MSYATIERRMKDPQHKCSSITFEYEMMTSAQTHQVQLLLTLHFSRPQRQLSLTVFGCNGHLLPPNNNSNLLLTQPLHYEWKMTPLPELTARA